MANYSTDTSRQQLLLPKLTGYNERIKSEQIQEKNKKFTDASVDFTCRRFCQRFYIRRLYLRTKSLKTLRGQRNK